MRISSKDRIGIYIRNVDFYFMQYTKYITQIQTFNNGYAECIRNRLDD
jgi:hypothetical protein